MGLLRPPYITSLNKSPFHSFPLLLVCSSVLLRTGHQACLECQGPGSNPNNSGKMPRKKRVLDSLPLSKSCSSHRLPGGGGVARRHSHCHHLWARGLSEERASQENWQHSAIDTHGIWGWAPNLVKGGDTTSCTKIPQILPVSENSASGTSHLVVFQKLPKGQKEY